MLQADERLVYKSNQTELPIGLNRPEDSLTHLESIDSEILKIRHLRENTTIRAQAKVWRNAMVGKEPGVIPKWQSYLPRKLLIKLAHLCRNPYRRAWNLTAMIRRQRPTSSWLGIICTKKSSLLEIVCRRPANAY